MAVNPFMAAVTILFAVAATWELAHSRPWGALMYAGWAAANVGVMLR